MIILSKVSITRTGEFHRRRFPRRDNTNFFIRTMSRRYREGSRGKRFSFEFQDDKASIIEVISLRSDDTRGRMRSVCNELPRGCNSGIFTMFDRRNKSSKQSITDGNNGNRVGGGKRLTLSLALSLSLCLLVYIYVYSLC